MSYNSEFNDASSVLDVLEDHKLYLQRKAEQQMEETRVKIADIRAHSENPSERTLTGSLMAALGIRHKRNHPPLIRYVPEEAEAPVKVKKAKTKRKAALGRSRKRQSR